jgi:hypothetical protein
MRRGRLALVRLALILLLLAVPTAAVAGHELNAHPVSADVDGDPAHETVSADRTRRGGVDYRQAVLHDDCDGTDPGWRLTPMHDIVPVIEVRELDGRPARPEILVEARSGASGRAGTVRLYRMVDPEQVLPSVCAVPERLFAYTSTKPRPKAPKGTWVAGFGVFVKNYRRSTKALELRLVENLARDGPPAVAANGSRTTYWRLEGDSYVRYRTILTRPTRVN